MPVALSSTASPHALVPGDDRALEELAARLRGFAAGAAEAAGQLRDIQAGSWVGEAADAFREQIGDLPRRLDRGADAFFAAQRALDAHADALREARQVAARAVDHWAEGERATARWEAEMREHQRAEQSALMTAALSGLPAASVGPGPSPVDPGADDRALATRLLEGARDSVDDSARAAAQVLREAAEAAPDEPSWLRRAAGQVGEFFAGAGEATWGMAVFAWKVSPTYALLDPQGFVEHGRGLVEGLVYGAQHPVEFAKSVLDWETWKENPARALGRLVPDLLLTLATAGAGAASRGARGLETAGDLAASRRAVDDVDDVPRVAPDANPSRHYGLEGGRDHAAGAAPEQLASGPPAQRILDQALADPDLFSAHGVAPWSRQDLIDRINTPTSQLSAADAAVLTALRDRIPAPQAGEWVQKVLTPDAAAAYLDNVRGPRLDPTLAGGSVTRAVDTAHLGTPGDLHDALRLDYAGTPFTPAAESVHVLRFRTLEPEFTVPRNSTMGGDGALDAWSDPFTGNGFTKAGGDVIPEWQTRGAVPMKEGSEMWEVLDTGTQRLSAVLINERWVPVAGRNGGGG